MNELLNVTGVTKTFGKQQVLKGVNLSLSLGECVHISGDNGCGKSTLLFIITQLLQQDSGKIHLDKNAYIGALIENPAFADFSTIKENLSYLAKLKGNYDEEYIKYLCNQFQLDYEDKKPIKKYSIGMKQKCGIIQAIMEHQNIVLLDEPTRGLDESSQRTFVKIINELVKNKKAAVLITSHDDIRDLLYSRKYKLTNGVLNEV